MIYEGKIKGGRNYNYKSINNRKWKLLVVEMNDNKITQKFFDNGKEV